MCTCLSRLNDLFSLHGIHCTFDQCKNGVSHLPHTSEFLPHLPHPKLFFVVVFLCGFNAHQNVFYCVWPKFSRDCLPPSLLAADRQFDFGRVSTVPKNTYFRALGDLSNFLRGRSTAQCFALGRANFIAHIRYTQLARMEKNHCIIVWVSCICTFPGIHVAIYNYCDGEKKKSHNYFSTWNLKSARFCICINTADWIFRVRVCIDPAKWEFWKICAAMNVLECQGWGLYR